MAPKGTELSQGGLYINRFIYDNNVNNIQKLNFKDIKNQALVPSVKRNDDIRIVKSKHAPSRIPNLHPRRVDARTSRITAPTKPIKTSVYSYNIDTTKSENNVVVKSASENLVAYSNQMMNGAIKDVDAKDAGDPQLVSEYVNDIYHHLFYLETQHPLQKDFLKGQVVTPWMRSILVDWLVQVGVRFNMLQETMYLTVAILDRYLGHEKNTSRENLQLVGITSLMIACKYEETYLPEIGDFVYITDSAYSKRDIRLMEIKVLQALGGYVSFPLGLHFLRRFSKVGCVTSLQHTMAKYLMELCLTEYHMAHYKPSHVAASALNLSIKLLGERSEDRCWTETLVHYSTYKEYQLLPSMCRLAAIVERSHNFKLKGVREKYATSKFMKISQCPHLKSKLIKAYASKVAQKGSDNQQ